MAAQRKIPVKQNTTASLSAFRQKPFPLVINGQSFMFFLDMNGLACLQEQAANFTKSKPLYDQKGRAMLDEKKQIIYSKQSLTMDDVLIGASMGQVRELSILLWAGVQYEDDISYKEFTSLITMEDMVDLKQQIEQAIGSVQQSLGTKEDEKNADAPKTSKARKKRVMGA